MGQSLSGPPNEFTIVAKNKTHSVLNPFVHINVPSHWADRPAQLIRLTTPTPMLLPHIASELADTHRYYLNEL